MIQYDKYAEEELQHGLGVGSGRGRPKGSRNGYINPNAAYMKDYQVVGQKAMGEDPNQPMKPTPAGMLNNYRSGQRTIPRQQVQNPPRLRNAQKEQIKSITSAGSPKSSVQTGKTLMENVLHEKILPETMLYEQTLTEQTPPAPTPTNRSLQQAPKQTISSEVRPTLAGQAAELVEAGKAKAQEAGKAIATTAGNAAGAVGKEADRLWNGGDRVDLVDLDDEGNPVYEVSHEQGLRQDIEDSLVDAGDTVKSWWDNLLDWGESTWNNVSSWTMSQVNNLRNSDAYKSTESWINARLNDVTGWANTAYRDVYNWIGERGDDLNRWWNGYDVHNNTIANETTHVKGFRENATDTINRAANDVWNGVDRLWNGYETAPTGSPEDRERRQAGEVDYHPGLRQQIETGVNNLWNNTVDTADRVWNGYETTPTGSPEDRERRQAGEVDYHPGLRQQLEATINNVRNAPGDAVEAVRRQIVDPVTGAVQTYLIDPVTGAYRMIDEATKPAREAIATGAQNLAKGIDENIIQPVANWGAAQAESARNTFSAAQMNGDAQSTAALNSGYSPAAVQYLNSITASGEITPEVRSQIMGAMDVAAKNGKGNVAAMYLSQLASGEMSPNKFLGNMRLLANEERNR